MEHKRKIIYWTGFIFSLSIALMSYINSSFLSFFIDKKFVGAIYSIASLISLLALLAITKIFRKVGGYKFLLWIVGLNVFSILFFAFSKNAIGAVIFFICIFVFNILIYFSLDELLKIFSKNSTTGKIRGSYLALGSLAWIIAQLALGTILGGFSFKSIYLVSFVIMLLFFIISYFHLAKIPDPEYDKMGAGKYIKAFLKHKNLFRSYSLSFLLQLFYCWMVIYTPIYLSLYLGFTWKEIGIIFAIMLLPFILIPLPLGKYADKIGERKILMSGFAIASLSVFSLFFIQIHEIWIWALLLFCTRVGASSIEVACDAYFFKHITPENEEYVRVYRTAAPIAYIIGPLFAFIFFIFIPTFNFIYLILSAILLSGIYISSTIKKSDI